MHETPDEFDALDTPPEVPFHASKTVVSTLRRALSRVRNRENIAAAQAAQLEKVIADLTGGKPAN